MDLVRANLDIERQTSDERRPKGPGANLGPDLGTVRRSQARRRIR
jgi:hypothetical protein